MDLQKIKVVAMDLDGTLTQHRQHPEKYRNLQVRVCGWNIPWNNMSKKNRMLNFKSRKSA